MRQKLKDIVINMKSLSQDIVDPIVVGAGDANGRTITVVFTQQAAEQFDDDTKVYLKWHHNEKDINGYNVFTDLKKYVPTWQIFIPRAMLYEGTVLCTIELVDDVSIAPSQSFLIKVVSDPFDSGEFEITDDFSIFQQAAILMNTIESKVNGINDLVENIQDDVSEVKKVVEDAEKISKEAKDNADAALKSAKEALDNSNKANASADEAVKNASSASETADNAKATSEEALDIAKKAKETVEDIDYEK